MADKQRRGTHADEDFAGKYETASAVHRRLLNGYFQAVRELIDQIPPEHLRTALEVGCGLGYSTDRLLSLVPPPVQLEASDYLDWQAAAAQQRLPRLRITRE